MLNSVPASSFLSPSTRGQDVPGQGTARGGHGRRVHGHGGRAGEAGRLQPAAGRLRHEARGAVGCVESA